VVANSLKLVAAKRKPGFNGAEGKFMGGTQGVKEKRG